MSPKRELSLEQIQEIRALRDKLPAAEAKKRFGIGSTRLYKIWRDAEPSGPLEPAGPQSLLPAPTVEDFYNRLGRLESRAEQATGLLVEVLAVLSELAQHDDSDLLDELQEEIEETAEEVQETQDEQAETRMDIQEMAKTTQTWIYISTAVLVAWKVAVHTWNQCTPALPGTPVGSDNGGTPPQDEQQSAVVVDDQQQENAKPGNPHYMA